MAISPASSTRLCPSLFVCKKNTCSTRQFVDLRGIGFTSKQIRVSYVVLAAKNVTT